MYNDSINRGATTTQSPNEGGSPMYRIDNHMNENHSYNVETWEHEGVTYYLDDYPRKGYHKLFKVEARKVKTLFTGSRLDCKKMLQDIQGRFAAER